MIAMTMQRSTQLKIARIGLVAGSCLSLVATLMLVLVLAIQYIIPHSVGSYVVGISPIDTMFYVTIIASLIGFVSFVLGFNSIAKKSSKSKKGSVAAVFVLFTGVLLFVNYLPTSIFGERWSILSWNFGLPMIVLASLYLTILVRKEETNLDEKGTHFLTSGSIMILCTFETILFLNLFPSTLYFLALSICTIAIASTAGILMLIKKFRVATALTVLTFLLGIALSVLFLAMFLQVPPASWLIGLLYESPIIVLSGVALVFAVLGQRNVNKLKTKPAGPIQRF
jgi:hypothetical protein